MTRAAVQVRAAPCDLPFAVPPVQRLHAPSSDTTPHGVLRRPNRPVNSGVQSLVAPFDDGARQPAKDNLDQASLVDSAAGSVHVEDPHAHALHRRRELSQLHTQLPADVLACLLIQFDPYFANVGRDAEGALTITRTLSWSRDVGWKRSPFLSAGRDIHV